MGMIGFERKHHNPVAYLVGSEPVKRLRLIDAENSIASPYFKGSLAYA